MAPDGVTYSGPASPDSGEESTDNGELGTECGEPDTAPTTAMTATTTEDPDAGPDASTQAPRFSNLDSPADRYVPSLTSSLFHAITGPVFFLSHPPNLKLTNRSSPSNVDLNPASTPQPSIH